MTLDKLAITTIILQIKHIVQYTRTNLAKTINQQLLNTYWEIGRIIVEEERAAQGKTTYSQLIQDLSKRLTTELGKGFSVSNLFNMKGFYLAYQSTQTVSGQLSWSHYCELMNVSGLDKRSFYEQEAIKANWSVRELKRQVRSSLFERLLLSKGDANKQLVLKMAQEGQILQKPEDILKDPYVFEFLGVPENKPLLEKDLEKKLLRHLEDFLLELGRGFLFAGSQQRITLDNHHFYVDLVFYNKILKCYVLIDLKTTPLDHTHVGQMNMYLNYYKEEINDEDDNPPIGIILSTDRNDVMAKYALGGLTNQIFSSKYVYYIPNKEVLIQQLEYVLQKNGH